MKKIIPPILFALSICVMVVLWFIAPIKDLLHYPYNLIGVLFIVVGVGIAKRGSDAFERVGTNIETFQKPDIIVTDGLFSISRNPMYLGFVVALLGVAITLGNLSSFFVALAFIVITDRWYIPFEEAAMEKEFGEQYIQYKTVTRRWL